MAPKKPAAKAAPAVLQTAQTFLELDKALKAQAATGSVEPSLAMEHLRYAFRLQDELEAQAAALEVEPEELSVRALLDKAGNIHRAPITVKSAEKMAKAGDFLAAHEAALGEAAEAHRTAMDTFLAVAIPVAKAAIAAAAAA